MIDWSLKFCLCFSIELMIKLFLFLFFILYYSRKIECMKWYGNNDLECKVSHKRYMLKYIYISMLQHDLISILPEFIVYISNQNALFIQRETQSYFPGSNLFYILPQILKQSLDNKSIADLFALNHKKLCFQALNIPSVQNTI